MLHQACSCRGLRPRLPPFGIPPVVAKPLLHSPAAISGELAILTPALGTSSRLLNADHSRLYFEGMPALQPPWSAWCLRRHGDKFERLAGGCYRALGRMDDTMNLGGIKVGSGGGGVGGGLGGQVLMTATVPLLCLSL
jgi:acyl-coenzyme A synthetase/AMP-(fatty) acid ligase